MRSVTSFFSWCYCLYSTVIIAGIPRRHSNVHEYWCLSLFF